VSRLARRVRQHADPGLTPSQLSALTTVARWGPLRPSELARRERISRSTLTRLIDRLERIGSIERLADPADGRSALIAVSEQGAEMLESSQRRADAYLSRQIDALTPDEQALLAASVRVLERLLQVKA
jgi:DNA-binding MarR family transcriptional regulator